jgi:TonB-dependent receptor
VVDLKKVLLCGVSAAAMGTLTLPAYAADDQVETVVVTGIRASLRNAQDLKKNSDVIQDSISAEDIGALPDRSVTEALQRIPGVAINRFAGSNDPDHFSAEGSGVTIRGLNDTRSEFNGRDTFTANDGRALSFADVPAELLAGIDVFKSPSAEQIEGGIGGTVNLRTRLPFDANGQVIAFAADGTYSDKAQKTSFGGSGLYSNRWDTPVGEFGLLLAASRSQLFTRSDGTQIAAWGAGTSTTGAPGCPAGQTCYVPEGGDARIQNFDHVRYGYSAAGQWKSNDDTLLATFQFIRSDSQEAWNEHTLDVAADVVAGNGDCPGAPVGSNGCPNPPTAAHLQPIPGTTWTFDKQGLFTKGLISQNSGWRSADNTVPVVGLQAQDITRGVQEEFITDDYSFNLKWAPTNHWAIDFDAQHVASTSSNLDVQTMLGTWVTADMDTTHGGIPALTFLPATNTASQDPTTYFQDPANYFWRSAMDHIEQSSGHEDAFKADAEYTIDDGFVDSVKVGVRYADREQDVRYTTYNWGALSEVWDGSNGPVWLAQNAAINPAVQQNSCNCAVPANSRNPALVAGGNLVSSVSYAGFQGGSVPIPVHGLFLTQNPVTDYANFSAQMVAINHAWAANGGSIGWTPLAGRAGVVPGTPFLPQEINETGEKTTSAYAELKFGGDSAFGGNVGVRWVHTADGSSGFVDFPAASSIPNCTVAFAGGTPPLFCQLPPAQQAAGVAFAVGGGGALKDSDSFDDFLPSLNLKYKLTDSMLLRAGLSQSITRPDMGDLRDFVNITFGTDGVFEAQAGNPHLKPVKATNYDLSYEWYFADVGSLTAAAFYKTLDGVFTNSFTQRTFTNNSQSETLIVQGPANATTQGTIKGFELAYNQGLSFLPDPFDGLGFNANYTYIESGGVAPQNLTNTNVGPGVVPGGGCAGPCVALDFSKLPLEQLSRHNVNIEGYYEKGPIEIRLAYDWRSRFLLTTRDVVFPFYPIFNMPTGTLDGSAFYSIDDHMKIGVQGVNLLNEVTRTDQVINSTLLLAPRSYFTNDRRISLVFRAQF